MTTSTLGPTLTRIALGVVLLAHSAYLKLVVFGLPGTAGYFESIGFPGVFAYLVFGVEVIAGVALIAGYRTQAAALAAVPILLGATWVHWQSGWLFSNSGGGWEYPALLAVLAIAQALMGPGSLAMDNRSNRSPSGLAPTPAQS